MKYLVLIVIFLVSCSEAPLPNFKINEIRRLNNGLCCYENSSGRIIFDTCGKFNVGDTIKLVYQASGRWNVISAIRPVRRFFILVLF